LRNNHEFDLNIIINIINIIVGFDIVARFNVLGSDIITRPNILEF
jgi:hypothetical protein